MSNWWDSDPVSPAQSPHANAIAGIESGGNYRAVGPQTGKGRALGKYQVMDFNVGPWTEQALGQRMTPMQFLASPEAQDKVFQHVFGGYEKKYGPEGAARAWFAGEGGMNNPNAKDVLGTTVSAYAEKFNKASAQPAQPSKNWWDADPKTEAPLKITVNPVSERFAEPEKPANAPALEAGLQRQAKDMTTGPATSPVQRMAVEHGNMLAAASQGATPNMDILSKNLLSTEVFQGDDGSILFRDPQSGQVVPTDNTKHIVMRDPADNTPKVYAKSDATTENAAVGVARTLAPGFATGAPTQTMNVARRVPTVPTVEQLRGAATAGYQGDAVGGLTVAPREFAGVIDGVKAELTKRGLASPVAAATWRLLDDAVNAPDGAVQTGQNIQSLRAALSHAAKTPGTSDGAAAMIAKRAIDDALPRVTALEGDAAEVAKILRTADQNYSAAKDAQMLTDRTYRAELRSSSANSGMNAGNTIRQRLTDILTTPRLRRGLTQEQIELAERIVHGGKKENTLRMVGNMLGGGGGTAALASGLGSGAAAAYSTGDPTAFFYGAAVPAAGLLLRSAGNRITVTQANKLEQLLRADSPLGRQMANPLQEWDTALRRFNQARNARNFAIVNIASRNLSNNLKDIGIHVPPGDLMRAIQSPRPVAAEDQQQQPRLPSQ